ncbi:MAG: folylpolyglutamate synthase/dihydrofolate synthase family protein [Planctomycetota bacterium]
MGKTPPIEPKSAPKPVVVEVPPELRVESRAGRAPDPLTLEQAMALLAGRMDVERLAPAQIPPATLRLDRMRAIVQALGHPEREFKSVHVAGSKGKGSTCEMVAAALTGCGYATGLYTSPHLINVRERIRLGSSPISEGDFLASIRKVAAVLPSIEKKHGPATFFEINTAVAFVYFAAQAVDVAVIEVGLGGRLDSTNVITPEVAAITAIQLEHTAILGDTLAAIAGEKAGIFKAGVKAITIDQPPEVLEVFTQAAASVGCPFQVVGREIEFTHRFERATTGGPSYVVCLSTPRSNFEHFPVPLMGEHQALNCGLALGILDALRERDMDKITDRGVAAGLARTPSIGRIEEICRAPRIVADGAHTPDSIRALLRAIGTHLKYDNLIVVFGCAADKDVGAMVAKLAAGADKVIFTKATDNARAMEPRELQRRFAEASGKMTQTAPTLKEAINLAARAAGREDLICVTGSFYVAGEAKKLLAERATQTNA